MLTEGGRDKSGTKLTWFLSPSHLKINYKNGSFHSFIWSKTRVKRSGGGKKRKDKVKKQGNFLNAWAVFVFKWHAAFVRSCGYTVIC